MRVIAYTYEADVHCPTCAANRFAHSSVSGLELDEHGIWYGHTDREGNLIHPVFDIDEHDFTHCGDCHEELT